MDYEVCKHCSMIITRFSDSEPYHHTLVGNLGHEAEPEDEPGFYLHGKARELYEASTVKVGMPGRTIYTCPKCGGPRADGVRCSACESWGVNAAGRPVTRYAEATIAYDVLPNAEDHKLLSGMHISWEGDAR